MRIKKNQILLLLLSASFSSAVLALPAGQETEYNDNEQGKVVFNSQAHIDEGLSCNDCHSETFSLPLDSLNITLEDHSTGDKYCFTCHNGSTAKKPEEDCTACHQK